MNRFLKGIILLALVPLSGCYVRPIAVNDMFRVPHNVYRNHGYHPHYQPNGGYGSNPYPYREPYPYNKGNHYPPYYPQHGGRDYQGGYRHWH